MFAKFSTACLGQLHSVEWLCQVCHKLRGGVKVLIPFGENLRALDRNNPCVPILATKWLQLRRHWVKLLWLRVWTSSVFLQAKLQVSLEPWCPRHHEIMYIQQNMQCYEQWKLAAWTWTKLHCVSTHMNRGKHLQNKRNFSLRWSKLEKENSCSLLELAV